MFPSSLFILGSASSVVERPLRAKAINAIKRFDEVCDKFEEEQRKKYRRDLWDLKFCWRSWECDLGLSGLGRGSLSTR